MRILAIHTYPGANAAVVRHYPYYENAGADRIIGITTEGGGCQWPTADALEIGPDSYVRGSHLCDRLIRTIHACLLLQASEIIIAQYDKLFFNPIPRPLPEGRVINGTGGGGIGFRGSAFYHGPWCMGAETAARVVALGNEMITMGDIEGGWPDRFIGWLAEKNGVPVVTDFFRNYTQNTIDNPERIEAARQARLAGVHAIHGIKTKEQLDGVLA